MLESIFGTTCFITLLSYANTRRADGQSGRAPVVRALPRLRDTGQHCAANCGMSPVLIWLSLRADTRVSSNRCVAAGWKTTTQFKPSNKLIRIIWHLYKGLEMSPGQWSISCRSRCPRGAFVKGHSVRAILGFRDKIQVTYISKRRANESGPARSNVSRKQS